MYTYRTRNYVTTVISAEVFPPPRVEVPLATPTLPAPSKQQHNPLIIPGARTTPNKESNPHPSRYLTSSQGRMALTPAPASSTCLSMIPTTYIVPNSTSCSPSKVPRITKRKHVITFDICPEAYNTCQKVSITKQENQESHNSGLLGIPAKRMKPPPHKQTKQQEHEHTKMNFAPSTGSNTSQTSVIASSLNELPAPADMPIYGQLACPQPMIDKYKSRRSSGQVSPSHRNNLFKRSPELPCDPLTPQHPTPIMGMCQGKNPMQPYKRTVSPPPLGTCKIEIPATHLKILEYIDQDPIKTIEIDGIPREVRFYGETAIIMLDWDDPREIKFLPSCRRITLDCKDSILLQFNEEYKQVEYEGQVFDIKFGAPTRELYINGSWYECSFGGQPFGVIIDGNPRLVHVDGPLPPVDIGKIKRTDLVAGKIYLIINAVHMCPVYLDAKVQKFHVNGQFYTIRFVDALMTVLINEQPFKFEFGGMPKAIYLGSQKYLIRFSALPQHVKPGQVKIVNMEEISQTMAKGKKRSSEVTALEY